MKYPLAVSFDKYTEIKRIFSIFVKTYQKKDL